MGQTQQCQPQVLRRDLGIMGGHVTFANGLDGAVSSTGTPLGQATNGKGRCPFVWGRTEAVTSGELGWSLLAIVRPDGRRKDPTHQVTSMQSQDRNQEQVIGNAPRTRPPRLQHVATKSFSGREGQAHEDLWRKAPHSCATHHSLTPRRSEGTTTKIAVRCQVVNSPSSPTRTKRRNKPTAVHKPIELGSNFRQRWCMTYCAATHTHPTLLTCCGIKQDTFVLVALWTLHGWLRRDIAFPTKFWNTHGISIVRSLSAVGPGTLVFLQVARRESSCRCICGLFVELVGPGACAVCDKGTLAPRC